MEWSNKNPIEMGNTKVMIKRFNESFKYRTGFIKTYKKYDLIIYDNLLPSNASPWRSFEFNELVKKFGNSIIYTDMQVYKYYDNGNDYEKNIKSLGTKYPDLASRIIKTKAFSNINAKLVYCLFYDTIVKIYPTLNRLKINYSFTLYPKGGFLINNSIIDNNLISIIKNPLCKFVIVNQETTYNYLIDKLKLPKDKIHLIFGVPIDSLEYLKYEEKLNNEATKCLFIGNKYMPFGIDKGFDTFQNLAFLLKENPKIEFYVIGNMSEDDCLIPSSNIKFLGPLYDSDLLESLSKMDIVISPSRNLKNGAFDGFPLAASITAGIVGGCMLLSNPNNEATKHFINNKHYFKIDNDFTFIKDKILFLIDNKDELKKVSEAGKKVLLELYSYNSQIVPRLDIFNRFL